MKAVAVVVGVVTESKGSISSSRKSSIRSWHVVRAIVFVVEVIVVVVAATEGVTLFLLSKPRRD